MKRVSVERNGGLEVDIRVRVLTRERRRGGGPWAEGTAGAVHGGRREDKPKRVLHAGKRGLELYKYRVRLQVARTHCRLSPGRL